MGSLTRWRGASVLLLLFLSTSSHATTVRPVSAKDLVKEAELIFRGTVTRVVYRDSSEDPSLTHSFVTFQVEQILLGRTSSPSVTLRFLGGLGPGEKILLVEGCPLFQVGDRGILFARKNGRSACPLVGWHQGAYRIKGEDLLTDDGREVWLSPEEELTSGSSRDSFGTFKIGQHTLRKVLVHSPREGPRPDRPLEGSRLGIEDFALLVRELAVTVRTPDELAALPPLESADPERPFAGPSLEDVPPPLRTSGAPTTARDLTEEADPVEEQAYRLSQDPVMARPRPVEGRPVSPPRSPRSPTPARGQTRGGH